MDDEDGPNMAQWFHEALLENELIRLEDIPYVLDVAVQKLYKAGVPSNRWATYIHLGASFCRDTFLTTFQKLHMYVPLQFSLSLCILNMPIM
jgi:hypothetical protein